MQEGKVKSPVFVQKSKTTVNYQYALDEMSYEDLLDPKAAEKAKQHKEAALKLQKVSLNTIHQCWAHHFYPFCV